MKKVQEWFFNHITPFANKIEQVAWLQAVKDGMVASVPIIIIGSFCTIFLGINNLIGKGPIFDFLSANMKLLTYASAFTTDFLAIYATYYIAKSYSERRDNYYEKLYYLGSE